MNGTPQPDGRVERHDVPDDSCYELMLGGLRVGVLDCAVLGDTFTALHPEYDDLVAAKKEP